METNVAFAICEARFVDKEDRWPRLGPLGFILYWTWRGIAWLFVGE